MVIGGIFLVYDFLSFRGNSTVLYTNFNDTESNLPVETNNPGSGEPDPDPDPEVVYYATVKLANGRIKARDQDGNVLGNTPAGEDDSIAMYSAISYVGWAGGGTVYIFPGEYIFETVLDGRAHSRITYQGNGTDLTNITMRNETAFILGIGDYSTVRDIYFQGIGKHESSSQLGIDVQDYGLIENNEITQVPNDAIHIMGDSHVVVRNNVIHDGGEGIEPKATEGGLDVTNITINYNTVYDMLEEASEISSSVSRKISDISYNGNNFSNSLLGVYLFKSGTFEDITFFNNTLTNITTGFQDSNVGATISGINITGNVFENVSVGIRAGYKAKWENSTIHNNNFTGITTFGIISEVGLEFSTISNNTINLTNIYDGIKLTLSVNVTLQNNTIYNATRYGIYLISGVNGVIQNNTIYNCTDYGIYSLNTNSTNFNYNELSDNKGGATQGKDHGGDSNNVDYNYWNDHTSPDTTPEDGIVDTPYVLDGNPSNQDNYPLVNPP